LPQPPKKLGKWACATTNKWVKHLEVSWFISTIVKTLYE
jgi:hypothetical protein